VDVDGYRKYVSFKGKLVMLGCGSIGQGTLPLLLRHIDIRPDQIEIVTADERGRDVAAACGVTFHTVEITGDNYRRELGDRLKTGDFLLNLSVDVSSVSLVEMCQEKGVSYLDTCIEPWPGGYTDPSLSPSERSNYALRETALAMKRRHPGGTTAVITHGANPGLVSHFIKEGLLNLARDKGEAVAKPADRAGWARLMQSLGVRVVHIAERDTQVSNRPKAVDEFVNTWSIDGFVSEGCQPAELGWGSHEKTFPADGGRHAFGNGAAIYLNRPGAGTKVRTWTPLEGPFHGFLVTHSEAISTADYYSVVENGEVRFRPTVHYAYHPCDDAVLSIHELAGKNWRQQGRQRLMMGEIVSGIDELGVLLLGHERGAYWYGSHLSIEEARHLAPYNNATSLQVTAPAMAGVVWALENPGRGVVEPEALDHSRILEIARPYLGPVAGHYSDWTPLQNRSPLFPEDLDLADPWQFQNFRVF
jgi:homospermidine synthase